MTHLDHMTEALAKEFCAELRATITAEELAEAVRLNHEDGEDSDVCHTHDFCDPNQCILDVFARHGIECDALMNEYTELMDAVWTMAKRADFAL